jgi:hypothetical protein
MRLSNRHTVRLWPITDTGECTANVRFRGNSGHPTNPESAGTPLVPETSARRARSPPANSWMIRDCRSIGATSGGVLASRRHCQGQNLATGLIDRRLHFAFAHLSRNSAMVIETPVLANSYSETAAHLRGEKADSSVSSQRAVSTQ